MAAKFIIAYLAALKADILLGKPIVDIFGTVEVCVLEGWKYYTLAVIAWRVRNSSNRPLDTDSVSTLILSEETGIKTESLPREKSDKRSDIPDTPVIAYPTWVFIACLCSTGVGLESYHSILKIKHSFVKFLNQHPCKDFKLQTFQFTAKNLSHIQNNRKEDQSYEDCISLEPIPANWIHAPRFIQIGTMIYCS